MADVFKPRELVVKGIFARWVNQVEKQAKLYEKCDVYISSAALGLSGTMAIFLIALMIAYANSDNHKVAIVAIGGFFVAIIGGAAMALVVAATWLADQRKNCEKIVTSVRHSFEQKAELLLPTLCNVQDADLYNQIFSDDHPVTTEYMDLLVSNVFRPCQPLQRAM